MTTLRNWFRNADDRLDLMWTEPLSWLVMAAVVAFLVIAARRGTMTPRRATAIAGLGLWLVAAMAMTIYPIRGELTAPTLQHLEVMNVVPLWGTIDAIADSDGYLMSEEDWVAQRRTLAQEQGVPIEDINLDRRVHGPGLSVVLKDPIGNMVLFGPLGVLLPFGWARFRQWRSVAVAGAAVSGAIEISQLLFGLGSLGTIDDVLFNTAGALIGLAAYRLVSLERSTLVTV